VTGEDLIRANEEIYGHPRFESLRFQIFSMLDATDIKISIESVEIVSALDQAAALTNPRIKCSMVSTDENMMALHTIYQHTAKSPWESKFFRSVEDAENWVS